MSQFDTLSETRPRMIAIAAALVLSLSACPFSDRYAIDRGGGGGGGGDPDGGGGIGTFVTSTGTSTSTSTSTSAGGAGDGCTPQAAPGGACPPACDSCEGTTCIFECGTAPGEKCDDDILSCPADFACEVRCDGKDACKDASVMCPLGYACHVSCDGDDSCKGTGILCAGGVCGVACNSPQSCKEADFACGSQGVCSCEGFAQPLQTSGCESACSCTGCE